MTDIVERLRRINGWTDEPDASPIEAADEIDRLQRRVAALEQMISEELDATSTGDAANRMLIETAHEAVARRAGIVADQHGGMTCPDCECLPTDGHAPECQYEPALKSTDRS